MTHNRLLSNSIWNMVGQGGALLVALAAIPMLLRELGESSFGLFSVCLALIGFSGILDLGLGRVITAAVARNESENNRLSMSKNITSAMYILLFLGFTLAGVLALNTESAASFLIGDSRNLLDEANKALYVLAATIPVVLLGSGLRGVLEGFQEFRVIAKITMLTGALMFGLPAALSLATTSVPHLVAALLAVRVMALIMFYWACKSRVHLFAGGLPSREQVASLLRVGGWMTISNVVSPIMTNLDRLFVSSQISPAAAALHVAAYEITTKALLPAGSIANATFPVFATKTRGGEKDTAMRRYFWRAMLLTSLAAIVPSFVIFIFAREILTLWISAEFAAGPSSTIVRILSVGIAINGLAYIPFAFIQGIGKSDVAAKFHLFELAFFIPGLLFALEKFGVIGAAITWTCRVCIDTVLLVGYCLRKLK